MMKNRLTLILVCCILPLALHAAEHDFHISYSSDEGLPGMHIRSCSQEASGRMWVASGNGVYFYDGTRFKALDDYDYMQSCTKMTFAVQCAPGGRTWIASSNGAGFFDTVRGRFTSIEGFDSDPARDLDLDPDGNVWITSHSGIWTYDFGSRSAVRAIPEQDYRPEMAFFSSDGEYFYILSAEGSIIRHEMGSGLNFEVYPPTDGRRARCICESTEGRLWVALESGLIFRTASSRSNTQIRSSPRTALTGRTPKARSIPSETGISRSG